MFSQRYSCDRCRQQKVRCLKNWELSPALGGGGIHISPCERCTKADVPCVYSLKQRHRRSKGEDLPSPGTNANISQDLSSMLSSRDVPGYDLNDLMMPSLDNTMACIDEGDSFSWNNNNSDLTYHRDDEYRTQDGSGSRPTLYRDECKDGKDTLTAQLMRLSNRAIGATRELDCAVISMPLTVNSPVINEAFEAANALVRIINSIPLVGGPRGSSQSLFRDESERQLTTGHSAVFQALASHQHVLGLFRAVCDSVKRSLGSMGQGTEQQQQTLHGAGSSSAQFIMILQLIMHLLNRLGRSLRMEDEKTDYQQEQLSRNENSQESGSLQRVVESAKVMLSTLPDEHIHLTRVVEELQASIEEGLHV